MSQAVDALEELSSDPEARRLATKRMIDAKFHEMGLAIARDEATKQGIAIGEAKGIAIGEASMLWRQLERKFGPLGDDVRTRVQEAPAHELERWGERILSATSLAEVFAN